MSSIMSDSSTDPNRPHRPARQSGIQALNRIKFQSDQEQRRDQRERIKDVKFKQNIVKYKHTIDEGEGENEEDDNRDDAHMIDALMEDEYSSSSSESENSEEEEEDEDDENEEEPKEDSTFNNKKRRRENSSDSNGIRKKAKSSASIQLLHSIPNSDDHEYDDILDEDEEWGKNPTRRRENSRAYKRAVLHRSQRIQASRRIVSSACFDLIDAAQTEEERVEAIINEIFLPVNQQPEKRTKFRLTVSDLNSKINLQSPRTGLTLLMCFIEVIRVTDKYDSWYWNALLPACKNVNLLLTNHQGETLLQFLLASHKAHNSFNSLTLNDFEHRLFSTFFKSKVELLFQQSPSGGYPIESMIRTWVHGCRDHVEMLEDLCSNRFRHLTSMKIDEYGNTWLHLYLQLCPSLYWNNALLRVLDYTLTFLQSIDLSLMNAAGESIYQLLNNFLETKHHRFIIAKKRQQVDDERCKVKYGRVNPYRNASTMEFFPRLIKFMQKYEAKLQPQINQFLNQHMINDLSQICLSMMVGDQLHQQYLRFCKRTATSACLGALGNEIDSNAVQIKKEPDSNDN